MQALQHFAPLTAPLFLLVLIGYALTRWGRWPAEVSDALTRFVFSVAIPTLLFRLMSDFSKLPPVDFRLVFVYFGGCLLVYVVARAVGKRVFAMDGESQSVFAMGGIFSNNVLLGLPLAKTLLGEASVPAVSLVLVFNAMILWTLVTVSVEWARHRSASLASLATIGRSVLLNPVVTGILLGTGFGFLGVPMPAMIDRTLELVSQAAVPLSLIALGMGLAQFGIREGWQASTVICVVKLVLHPLAVLVLARLLHLGSLETTVVVLMAGLPVGANVYLMARQFGVMGGPVAASLVISTALAAVTTPLTLAATIAITTRL